MPAFLAIFGVLGAVILIAALLSGLLERTRLPQVLIFLALGTVLGPYGLGVIDLGIDSPALRIIATLGLVLVLFTDSVSLTVAEVRRHARLAAIILGPGTILTATVTALAAWALLDLAPAASVILGAALASTDPVLLRGVLRSAEIPEAARHALRIESGMNDAVLLPAVLIGSALLAPAGTAGTDTSSTTLVLELFALGIAGGVLVGFVGVTALDFVRRRFGMRRDYESLYALGVAITAFAAAEAAGGSGFLAAFAAGLTIAALDIELCDCFFDYGEATAEMALLFTFVALGSAAIWSGLGVVSATTVLFAVVALFARGVILLPALAWTRLDRRSLWLTVWFGPRGLSSLLLILLPVFAGVSGSERLFAVTSFVVLLSVAIHGGSQILLRPARAAAAPTIGTPSIEPLRVAAERIAFEELDELQRRGEPVALLDVRKSSAYTSTIAAGALRVHPDRAREAVGALNLPPDTWLVSYCA